MSRLPFTLVLAAALLLGGCDRGKPPEAQQQQELEAKKELLTGVIDRSHQGELMPAVNLADPDGRVLNLGAIQGRLALINLWATWCAPCVEEMPLLDDLAGDYAESLQLIAVSQDLRGAETVAPFFAEHKFANLHPWMDQEAELSFALGDTLPITILYDASGQEVWRVIGAYDWSGAEARAAIDAAIAE